VVILLHSEVHTLHQEVLRKIMMEENLWNIQLDSKVYYYLDGVAMWLVFVLQSMHRHLIPDLRCA